jgi:hypothetical protein
MKHLKSYKVFESTETEQDLKDILLELQDEGYKVIHNDDVMLGVTGEPGNIKAIWVRDVNNPSYSEGKDWEELRDYALRIKDYLGDKYLSFAWRPILLGSQGKENPYHTVKLNEDTQIDEKIYSFVIKYKE